MNSLNLEQYDRIFISGCSFTHYRWPTWADIISEEIGKDKVFNYGLGGAGNYYIVHSIMECDLVHKITERDLVMVMFSNVHREDRFVRHKGGWMVPGNIYSQAQYHEGWMEYWDEDHAFMRDLMLIRLLRNYLQNKKIKYHFMSMVNLGINMHGEDIMTEFQKKLVDMYQEDLADIKPSIHELIFDGDWKSIQPRSVTPRPWNLKELYEDNHAHPLEYLAYLQKLWPDTVFKQSTIDYANYWHQKVLDKKDPFYNDLIERKMNYRLDGTHFR